MSNSPTDMSMPSTVIQQANFAGITPDTLGMSQPSSQSELTGGSSDYYRIDIAKPLAGYPYSAECLDIIMALGMTFAEGEAFKAIWRKAAARQGNGKAGNTALYNAEKVAFFGQAMVRQETDNG